MSSAEVKKIIFQSDFDGTITDADASFILLDAFADGDWRQILKEYNEGRISVGVFNTRAFAMIKADEDTLLEYMFKSGRVKIRPGFQELLTCCSQKGIEFVIVSNGLQFYIQAILKNIGINNIKVFAAKNWFKPDGVEVKYIGPDGDQLADGFKQAYTELYVKEGYRVIYAGNGVSDSYAARKAHHVFATGELLETCRKTNLDCVPFNDLNDVVKGMEQLSLS